MPALANLDHRYIWHPFTQMRDWLNREPIVIVEGEGAVLRDVRGREFLDANSSIWTNLHGHRHPKINAAIRRQLSRISHSSALGLANEPASRLAAELVKLANRGAGWSELNETVALRGFPLINTPLQRGARLRRQDFNRFSGFSRLERSAEVVKTAKAVGISSADPNTPLKRGVNEKDKAAYLGKVFFSDDGSTAMEVALKLAFEASRRNRQSRKPKFVSLGGAYHGDTVGAMALGHNPMFHTSYARLLFKTGEVMAPYCYRCPFNRAKPERADAREYRKCNWECVGKLEQKFATQKKRGEPYSGFVFEPLIQGAAGMIAQPSGWLRQASEIARTHGALLIADEVMTAFGRTGSAHASRLTHHSPLLACHHEGVQPDLVSLAKGLTGGYLPMAATVTTQEVFDAFLGDYSEFKTFFHGHSFTGNQLGAAAALANLQILQTPASVRARHRLEQTLRKELERLWLLPNVGDIRQVGLIAGVELVKEWRTRRAFDLREQAGIRVCEAMARRGVLTRPIGNVIVLMPPYCTTDAQVARMVRSLRSSVREVLGSKSA